MNGKAFSAFAFFCLLGSACGLHMDVAQKMDGVGNARMEVVLDTSSEAGNLSDACDRFLSATRWKSPSCSTEGNKTILRGILSLKDAPEYVIKKSVPYKTYNYDAKQVYSILSDTGVLSDPVGDPAAYDIDYVVEMPGEVVRADAGTARENRIELNAQDLAGREHAYMESRELNVSWIIGLASFIPIMLFVSYVAGRKQKKRRY